MLTVATLASGSSGNAALVSRGDTHILLDAGISARRIATGLRALGVDPADLSAILITHEHHDHISGLQVLTKHLRVPIVATPATCRQIAYKVPFVEDLLLPRQAGEEFDIGALWVKSFPTSHDAAGSVGYTIGCGDGRMALATDLGFVSAQVEEGVRGCDLLICETNHDEDWVRTGPYPYYLKQRILGDRGHLSNEAGAELAALGALSGAKALLLAHLSAENNTPSHARQAVARRLTAMGCDPEGDLLLRVAPRLEIGPVYRVEGGRVKEERGAALC